MSGGQDNLRNALREIAEETKGMSAAPQPPAALMAELRSRRRKSAATRWWPAIAAAAAALVIGIWVGLPDKPMERPLPVAAVSSETPAVPAPAPAPAPESRRVTGSRALNRNLAAARATRVSTPREERPVTPWYFNTGLPLSGGGHVVPVQVSAELAAGFGVYGSSETAKAQIFVGDDGLARAIRFVR